MIGAGSFVFFYFGSGTEFDYEVEHDARWGFQRTGPSTQKNTAHLRRAQGESFHPFVHTQHDRFDNKCRPLLDYEIDDGGEGLDVFSQRWMTKMVR